MNVKTHEETLSKSETMCDIGAFPKHRWYKNECIGNFQNIGGTNMNALEHFGVAETKTREVYLSGGYLCQLYCPITV